MNKIDLVAPENSFVLMCISECIGEDNEKLQKVASNISECEIELKVNGEEMDFMKIIQALHDTYYDSIEKAARNILSNQFEEIQGKAIEIQEELQYLKIEVEKKTE